MRLPHTLLAVAVSLWIAGIAHAQLPSARLLTAFPPGGQAGTSVDVTVSGIDLDELATLHFSNPSLSAKPKLDAAGKSVPNIFVVDIGNDVPPGSHDLRAVGKFGVTNPRAFVVDRDPQIVALAGNGSPEAASKMALNSGAYAVAVANTAQFYRIEFKAGQRAFIDVDAEAIDSKFEPVLVLRDGTGRELARDGQQGAIDFTASTDGPYLLEVHDVLYRGGPEFFYRLRVSTGPRLDFLLPPAASPNGLTELLAFGRNLPGATGTPEHLTMKLLDDEDAEASALRPRWYVKPQMAMLDGSQRYTFAGAVSPMFFGRASAPLVAESADNNEPAKAQKLSPPFELYGQFFPRADQDWITFDAKKGELFWTEVISNRVLGFTDPIVVVQRVTRDAAGKETSVDVKEALDPENIPTLPREFYATHRDPAFRLEIPEDGTYRLLVRDLFNEGSDDPRRVYRLSVVPAASREDFRFVAWPTAPISFVVPVAPALPGTQLWGSNLRVGGVIPISILAFRNAFYGDITLTAENLPAGVTCPPVVMNGNTNLAALMLIADEKAPPFVGPIRIVATAKSKSGSILREARTGTVVWPAPNPEVDPLRSRVAQEFVIAVTGYEPEPIAIRPAEEKLWEESVAGKIEIPLKAVRRGKYAGAIKLKPVGLAPKILAMPEFEIPAGAIDGKLTLDIGALELPPGNHNLFLQATSTGVYDRFPTQFVAAQAANAAADKATPELAVVVQKATEALTAAKAVANNVANVAAAEKVLAEANEKVKQNEAAKAALAEQIKALSPKDTLAYAYSPVISMKIAPAPITLAPPAATTVKVGAKADVPVAITRLFGFADAIDLSVVAPQGVAGLSAANIAIATNATQAAVSIQAAADAKPGEYTLTLVASLKQNGRPIKVEQSLRITVTPP